MKRLIGKALFAAALLFASIGGAEAAVITFTTNGVGPAPELAAFSDTFTEDGFDVEAFWGNNLGSASGSFTGGHFHFGGGMEHQHFNGTNQLQGIFIEAVGEGLFDLDSLQYQVASTTSINGFTSSQVYVLVATAFNPTGTAASQFTAIPVSGSGTLNISGFQGISSLFLASSASVSFDNITLSSVPEPGSMFLFGAGALGFAVRRMRRQ